MKFKLFIFSLVSLLNIDAYFAQTLTVNNVQLIFGATSEITADSQLVIINNPLTKPVNVTGIKFYTIYGYKAFSVRDSVFTINAGQNKSIYVKFAPKQNILHNTEMIILNNSGRGNVRVDLIGQGKYTKTYYNASQNLSEEDLKLALQTITGTGYNSLGYSNARDQMYMLIDNKLTNGQGASSNTLECVYTGRLAVGYFSRSDCQTNFSFNTEHTWPQSLFSSVEPMLSDLHHLYPTDEAANTARASYPFGVVTTSTWAVGGSKYGGGKFEPRDASKGAIARTMLYFAMRYQNYAGFLTSQEAILRTWSQAYPPNTIDIKRNNDIFGFQNNRNPFIDYPQYLDRITSISTTSVAVPAYTLDLTETSINYGIITPAQLYTYGHILVNTGNQAITISNVSVSGAGFGLQGGSFPNTTLAVGEALKIPVTANQASAGNHTGALTYQTNASGLSSVNIPIQANASPVGIASIKTNIEVQIHPNPASDQVHICFESEMVLDKKVVYSIFDIHGRLILSSEVFKSDRCFEIPVYELSAGYYMLTMDPGTEQRLHSRIIVSQH